MIRSITEFKKTFKLAIPYEPEFEYYLNVLMQSPEFAYLQDMLRLFEEFETSLNGESTKKARIRFQNQMIDRLKQSSAYRCMQAIEFKRGNSEQKLKAEHTGRILMSVDLVKANFNILRSFDMEGDLPLTWGELCEAEAIPEVLARSKSFRQVVFGNLNPKRSQQYQLRIIHYLMDIILHGLICKEKLMFVSPDEFILAIDGEGTLPEHAVMLMDRIYKWNTVVEDDYDLMPMPWVELPTQVRPRPEARVTFFRIDSLVEGETGSIKTHYEVRDDGQLVETHKTLYGVPGNRFYLNFKPHILGQEIETRDRYFVNENHLAQWVE